MKRMKCAAIAVLAALICLFVEGCLVLSVHPLYFEKDLIFDPALIGTWGNSKSESHDGEAWIFEKAGDKAYRLTYREDDGQIGHFEAHLVQLGSYLFLDLFPEEPEQGNEFFNMHLIPTHSFLRVFSKGETINLGLMDSQWLEDNLKDKKIQIKHERRDDMFVLTASTEELQAFVLKYRDEAFEREEEGDLHRWQ